MKPLIPKKMEPIAFGFLLSGMMSFLVSGIATARAIGLSEAFLANWLSSWLASWVIAFPSVLVVAPFVRKIIGRIVRPDR